MLTCAFNTNVKERNKILQFIYRSLNLIEHDVKIVGI